MVNIGKEKNLKIKNSPFKVDECSFIGKKNDCVSPFSVGPGKCWQRPASQYQLVYNRITVHPDEEGPTSLWFMTLCCPLLAKRCSCSG